MVSVYPNPPPGKDFYYMGDPMKMGLPCVHSFQPAPGTSANGNFNAALVMEDPNKKVRKPYTITKSRESWTEQEHDKFLEALQLFDRDWKKIEAFVGSKTVIQIRSHAQKYFLKVQKNGTGEHVPPPRPKRKAAHPYPQKAPKNVVFQVGTPPPSSAPVVERYFLQPDSLALPRNSSGNATYTQWAYNSVPAIGSSPVMNDDAGLASASLTHNCSSSNDSTPTTWPIYKSNDLANEKKNKQIRVMPDFAQVYRFIGSLFDPDVSSHLQRLKKMEPINVETVLMLMKNLSVNLISPEFEDFKRLLSAYSAEKKLDAPFEHLLVKQSVNVVPSV